MIESGTTRAFWRLFAALPPDIQQEARRAYHLFRDNPAHPSLRFKKLEGEDQVYSARIGPGYRALAAMKGTRLVWFWIGNHSTYDRLI